MIFRSLTLSAFSPPVVPKNVQFLNVRSRLSAKAAPAAKFKRSNTIPAPPVKGRGKAARVADWSEFDRRFGPLFDASAFKGTGREGVPLDHFYLTFHENWPAPIAGNYKWNVPKWERHWKVAGPIAEGFSKQYQETWKAVLADFDKHFKEKGWKGTRFQLYLNNKFFYKMYGRFGKRRGRGTSFWLLDEPTFARDFQALAFFSRLTRAALGGRSGSIVFRGDISRPESQRDTLDGLVDVNVCGDYAGYRRIIEARRARFGETLWTYGGLCKVEESALQLGARALTMYCRTVDGYVPWKTLDKEEAWTKPSDTIAFYSGRPVLYEPSSTRRSQYDLWEESDPEGTILFLQPVTTPTPPKMCAGSRASWILMKSSDEAPRRAERYRWWVCER